MSGGYSRPHAREARRGRRLCASGRCRTRGSRARWRGPGRSRSSRTRRSAWLPSSTTSGWPSGTSRRRSTRRPACRIRSPRCRSRPRRALARGAEEAGHDVRARGGARVAARDAAVRAARARRRGRGRSFAAGGVPARARLRARGPRAGLDARMDLGLPLARRAAGMAGGGRGPRGRRRARDARGRSGRRRSPSAARRAGSPAASPTRARCTRRSRPRLRSGSRSSSARERGALRREQRALALDAPAVAGQRAVGPDHAVAGHQHADPVRRACVRDRRTERGRPSSAASCVYVRVSPRGISSSLRQTASWNSVPRMSRSTSGDSRISAATPPSSRVALRWSALGIQPRGARARPAAGESPRRTVWHPVVAGGRRARGAEGRSWRLQKRIWSFNMWMERGWGRFREAGQP